MATDSTDDVVNALTFDLEHWYSATLVRDAVTDPVDRIETSVGIVLDLLDRYNVTATFFVVGEIAVEYPDLVANIADRGHDLATHGHTHTPLFDLDHYAFSKELTRSRSAIEDAADVNITGFRAPNFSICKKTAWAFDVLGDHGFAYDSSVFPAWTPMYGVRGAPHSPYTVDSSSPFSAKEGAQGLTEIPVAVHPKYNLPLAGGFYARFLPPRIVKWGIEALNAREYPATIYFHPWEFNPAVRSTKPPLYARWISYHGLNHTASILEELLETFEFGSVPDVRFHLDR